MRISVVVPAYNEEKLIVKSLQSIREAASAFHDIGWESELIVCDNNSTDKTAELARSAGARVVFEPINQISRARNAGAAAATGDWLVFIDADSRPSRELFADLAQHIQTGNYIGGGCTLTVDTRLFLPRHVTWVWNNVSRVTNWIAGAFVFCDANVFRELGGFSLELFASEEIDLSKRLKKLAAKDRKKLCILHKYPLLTSSRKMHLYSTSEYLQFLRKALFNPKKTLKSREACVPWYDGRR